MRKVIRENLEILVVKAPPTLNLTLAKKLESQSLYFHQCGQLFERTTWKQAFYLLF